jgi:hypothetical protein
MAVNVCSVSSGVAGVNRTVGNKDPTQDTDGPPGAACSGGGHAVFVRSDVMCTFAQFATSKNRLGTGSAAAITGMSERWSEFALPTEGRRKIKRFHSSLRCLELMNPPARGAVIDKANLGDAAKIKFTTLNAAIPDCAHSATRWSLAGHDQIDVICHDDEA